MKFHLFRLLWRGRILHTLNQWSLLFQSAEYFQKKYAKQWASLLDQEHTKSHLSAKNSSHSLTGSFPILELSLLPKLTLFFVVVVVFFCKQETCGISSSTTRHISMSQGLTTPTPTLVLVVKLSPHPASTHSNSSSVEEQNLSQKPEDYNIWRNL